VAEYQSSWDAAQAGSTIPSDEPPHLDPPVYNYAPAAVVVAIPTVTVDP
jgi:hypothetical protein